MAYPYCSPPPPPPPPPPPHAPCSPRMPPPPPHHHHHHHHHHKKSPPSPKHHHHHPKPPKPSPSPQSPPRNHCENYPPPTNPSHEAPPPRTPFSPPQPYTPPISPQKPPSSPPKPCTTPVSPSKPPNPHTPPASPSKPPSSPPKIYTPPVSPSKQPSSPPKPYTPPISPSKPPSRPPKPYTPPITTQKPPPYAPIPSPHNLFTPNTPQGHYPPGYYGLPPVPFNSIPPSFNVVATPLRGGRHITVIAVCVSLGGAFFLAFLLVGLVCLAKKKKPVYVPSLAPGSIEEHHAVRESVMTSPSKETMTITVEDDEDVIGTVGDGRYGGSPCEQPGPPYRRSEGPLPPPTKNLTSALDVGVSSQAITRSSVQETVTTDPYKETMTTSVEDGMEVRGDEGNGGDGGSLCEQCQRDPRRPYRRSRGRLPLPTTNPTSALGVGVSSLADTRSRVQETMTMRVEDDIEVIGTEGGGGDGGSPCELPEQPHQRSRGPLPPCTANPTSALGVGVSSNAVTCSRVQETVTTGPYKENMTISVEDGVEVVGDEGGEKDDGSPSEQCRRDPRKPRRRSSERLPPPNTNLTSTLEIGVSSLAVTRSRVQETVTTGPYEETMTMSMEDDVEVIGTEGDGVDGVSSCEQPDRVHRRSRRPPTANPTSALGVEVSSNAVTRSHLQEIVTADPYKETMTMSREDGVEVIGDEGGGGDGGSTCEECRRNPRRPHRRSRGRLPPLTTNPTPALGVGVSSLAVTRSRIQETVTNCPYEETMTMSVEDNMEVIGTEGGGGDGGSSCKQPGRPHQRSKGPLPPRTPNLTSASGVGVSSHVDTRSRVQESFTAGPYEKKMTMSEEDGVEVIGDEGGREDDGSPFEECWRDPRRPHQRSVGILPPLATNSTSTLGLGVSSHNVTRSGVQEAVITGPYEETMTMSVEDGMEVIDEGGGGDDGYPCEQCGRYLDRPYQRSGGLLPLPTTSLTSARGVGVSSHAVTRSRVQESATTGPYEETMEMSVEDDVTVVGTEGGGSPSEQWRRDLEGPHQRFGGPLPPPSANPSSALGLGFRPTLSRVVVCLLIAPTPPLLISGSATAILVDPTGGPEDPYHPPRPIPSPSLELGFRLMPSPVAVFLPIAPILPLSIFSSTIDCERDGRRPQGQSHY